MKADLHIHSRYSNDGEFEVAEIIRKCFANRVDTFSITDHNGVGGSREAQKLTLDDRGINFIPGIEIDARTASIKEPDLNQTSCPVIRSVATAPNVLGNDWMP